MSKTPDPRIAPKEMIVTRFKSAQQRRQLREKDRSMARATQLLKSPTQKKRKRGPKSPKKDKDKSPIVIDEDEPKEYYPEKLKRAPGERRVFLKPKTEMKMVAKTNKRKFNTPKKGIESRLSPWPESPGKLKSPVYSELSMEEVIRIVEETESLDDEDLMEILTCPSPVWWEGPPDEMYIEESICTRNPDDIPIKSPIKERCFQTYNKEAHKKVFRRNSKSSAEESNADFKMDVSDIRNGIGSKKTEKKDEKFIKKSKKLENVLGNIKNKAQTSKEIVKPDENKIKDSMVKDTIAKEDENAEKISVKHNEKEEIKKKNLDSIKINERDENKSIKVKKISESTEEDMAELNFRDDMLLDLENMDIPIENNVERSSSSDSIIFINDDECNKITEIGDDVEYLDVNAKSSNVNDFAILQDNSHIDRNVAIFNANSKGIGAVLIKQESSDAKEQNNSNNVTENADMKILDQTLDDNMSLIDDKAEIKLIEVPKTLPPLKKRPKIDNTAFASPVSIKSVDDTTETSSVSSHDISDTISDTNIKFIMDDDIDDISDIDSKVEISKKDEDDLEKDNISNTNECKDLNEDLKSKDYITVYKIVPNETKNVNNKFKTLPEYSSYVENLNQVDKSEINADSVTEVKGQINSFFKKCKNVNRKRCKKSEDGDSKIIKSDIENSLCESCEPKKSITVAQEENIKYCLKCSSIFDTDDCSYCLKSAETKSSVVCTLCDFVGDSSTIKAHLETHENAKT